MQRILIWLQKNASIIFAHFVVNISCKNLSGMFQKMTDKVMFWIAKKLTILIEKTKTGALDEQQNHLLEFISGNFETTNC